MTSVSRGKEGENRAAVFLQQHGCRILDRNFHTRGGEIDLIAADGDTLVFAEVKTRSYEAYGGPLGAVTPAKQRRIAQTALRYVQEKGLKFESIRFDVLCVLPERIEHIKNAFFPPRTTL